MAEDKQPEPKAPDKKIIYISSAHILDLMQGKNIGIPPNAIIELSFLSIEEDSPLGALIKQIIPEAKILRFKEQANGLNKGTLWKICNNLPEGLLELEFGAGCNLCEVDPMDIAKAFASIKSPLLYCGLEGAFRRKIDLDSSDDDEENEENDGNVAQYPNRDSKSILMVLQALPKSVQRLNLANNYLHKYTLEGLQVLFSNLPPNISDLDLSENFLGVSGEILQYIPENITTLNLCNNNLEKTAQWLFTLPKIKKLFLSKEELDNMNLEQKIAFLKVFPNLESSKIILYNDSAKLPIKDSVRYLQEHKMPSLKSLCALSIFTNNITWSTQRIPEQIRGYLKLFYE